MKRYEAKLSDGSTVKIEMRYHERSGITHVLLEYPVGNTRWPTGNKVAFYYGTFDPVGLLRDDGKVELVPHDPIREVQERILKDKVLHLVSWREAE